MADVNKPVSDIMPGDQVSVFRTVTEVTRTATQIILTFDDGATASFDIGLPGADPAIAVLSVDG